MNEEQCQQIANYKPVRIDKKHQHLVELCFAQSFSQSFELDGGNLHLKEAAVKHIRYLGVDYLNEVEIALSAWLRAIGDREYLESEFKFLDDDKMLVLFRDAFSAGSYPAIEAFLKRNGKEHAKNVDSDSNSPGSS